MVWLVASVLAWSLVGWLANGNLDGYFDMLENYAWAFPFSWGTHKHPPFFAWTTGLWFSVFPHHDGTYRLLSYVNVAVGLLGVVYLAKRLRLQHLATVAVLLLLWSFPYTTLAGKFNANSQLLSLWPWTAAMLLASFQEKGLRGLLFSVLLGVLAAFCMLSKYVSGVFLLGFLLPTFLSAEGRAWLRTPRPYIALLVFAAVLTPHVLWVRSHDWITLTYAMEQGDGHVNWKYVVRFALSPLFYWLPGWLAVTLVYAVQQRRMVGGSPLTLWRQAAITSWRSQGISDSLFWIAMATWAITLVFGALGIAELSTPWAIPIGFGFSLLWLRNLDLRFPQATAASLAALSKAFWPALALVLAVGAWQMWRNAKGDAGYYRPNEVAAHAIVQTWQRNHPATPLRWVGGDWAENALVEFYAQPDIRTLPGLPDSEFAQLNNFPGWQSQGGVLFCSRGAVSAAGDQPAANAECEAPIQEWLQSHGNNAEPVILKVQKPRSWRFPHPQLFVYALYDYLPPATRQAQP